MLSTLWCVGVCQCSGRRLPEQQLHSTFHCCCGCCCWPSDMLNTLSTHLHIKKGSSCSCTQPMSVGFTTILCQSIATLLGLILLVILFGITRLVRLRFGSAFKACAAAAAAVPWTGLLACSCFPCKYTSAPGMHRAILEPEHPVQNAAEWPWAGFSCSGAVLLQCTWDSFRCESCYGCVVSAVACGRCLLCACAVWCMSRGKDMSHTAQHSPNISLVSCELRAWVAFFCQNLSIGAAAALLRCASLCTEYVHTSAGTQLLQLCTALCTLAATTLYGLSSESLLCWNRHMPPGQF